MQEMPLSLSALEVMLAANHSGSQSLLRRRSHWLDGAASW